MKMQFFTPMVAGTIFMLGMNTTALAQNNGIDEQGFSPRETTTMAKDAILDSTTPKGCFYIPGYGWICS